ncbi:MAG: undecaprenyl-diphosphatase UppP [bacterium]
MNLIESLVLGIVQGLTEFLPVSSSGHLVIVQRFFNIVSENLAFEVVVHLGTLLSVLVVFYDDIIKMIRSFFGGIIGKKVKICYQEDYHFKLAILVIVGTVPAVIAGLFFNDFFKSIFHNVKLVGVTLLITAVILFLTRFVTNRGKKLTFWKSVLIGIGQAMAIFPGISRSGTTISTSLYLGLNREEAARFSFLLSIPAIAGAAVLELSDLFKTGLVINQVWVLIIGFIASFIVGYIAIRFLLRLIKTGKFSWFAPYCAALGIFVLLFL